MGSYQVTINEAYFADLSARYRSNFDDVNDGLTYACKTSAVSSVYAKDFKNVKNAIASFQSKLNYDITCIASVFGEADAEMKKRAQEIIGQDIISKVAGGGTVVVNYYDLEPNQKSPRNLDKTQYGYIVDKDGNLVYDHPEEQEKYLYRNQGSVYDNYKGTCGLCSCANVLRIAGVNYNEKDMIDFAKQHGYCRPGGGTGPADRVAILNAYGIPSKTEKVQMQNGRATDKAINDLAGYVEQGKGVIISVYAYSLWPGYSGAREGLHAITVTSVKRDASGNVLGFYVCDSNSGLPSYYSADKIQNSLSGRDTVVTKSAIH